MRGRHHKPTPLSLHPDHERFVREATASLPPLVTPDRAATLLGLHRRRIYEMVETGEVAAVRHGKRGIRIFRQSLLEWLLQGGTLGN